MKVPEWLPVKMLEYRANHSIGQNELAKRCALTVQTIGNIENRRRDGITKLTMAKIEGVIGKNEGE